MRLCDRERPMQSPPLDPDIADIAPTEPTAHALRPRARHHVHAYVGCRYGRCRLAGCVPNPLLPSRHPRRSCGPRVALGCRGSPHGLWPPKTGARGNERAFPFGQRSEQVRTKGSTSGPSSATGNGTLWAMSTEIKCTSRPRRSSLATATWATWPELPCGRPSAVAGGPKH